jgi:hypothetical protein
MNNVEYIFQFAEKHNFPKTNCEVMFNTADDGREDIYTTDDDIISVKFDKSLVANEIKMEDIRFDVDSSFPEDVFFKWQEDEPDISFRAWILKGKYIPTVVQNSEFFDELESLTKEIETKLNSIFSDMEDGDSDYYDEDDWDDDEDSDYEEDK